MPSKIQTVTTCQICEAIDIREGAHEHSPPDGWANLSLYVKGPNPENERAVRDFAGPVCGRCVRSFDRWLNEHTSR